MRIDRLKTFLNSVGGGAWPFLVGGVICLVNSVNERDLDLLNSRDKGSLLFLLLKGTAAVLGRGSTRQ